MKKSLPFVLILVMILVIRTTGALASEKIDGDRIIRVSTSGIYPPFTIYDERTKEWSGFDIELWRAIGERSGYDIQFVRFVILASFAELDLGRVDTVAEQVSITPARQKKYNFTTGRRESPRL